MELKDTMRSVAKEYARQFGLIIGCETFDYGPTGTYDLCQFENIDTMIFTFSEIQHVVDNLDNLIAKYGTKEEVGKQIKEWQDWAFSHDCLRVDKGHRYVVVFPRINLRSWLMGMHDTKKAETMSSIENKREVITQLWNEYGQHKTIQDVANEIENKYLNMLAQKEEQ